ncbi:hypothetical protein AALA80_14830 [Oscillospiraceae bacterium 50-60]
MKIAFLDDENPEAIGPCKILGQYVGEYSAVIPTIGNQMLRMRWIGELTQAGFILPVLIHPARKLAVVQRSVYKPSSALEQTLEGAVLFPAEPLLTEI